MVLPRFIEAAKAGTDLTIYGTGEQVRSFCHVNDAVEYLVRLESVKNEIFNLGSGDPISILELAVRVIDITGSTSKIVFVPYQQAFSKHHGDIIKRVPDLTKLKYFTNYLPVNDVDTIIKDML
jgi:UDP-glucose 4-epimerase